MFFSKKPKERPRFYLLPGQGGKNYHRKQRYLRRWAMVVGVLFGALLGVILWWMSRPKL